MLDFFIYKINKEVINNFIKKNFFFEYFKLFLLM